MRWSSSLSLALMSLAIVVPSASAAESRQRTDPDASSPAGVIYEIPLDSARRDAAPAKRPSRDRDGDGQAASTGAPDQGGGGTSSGGGSGSGASIAGSGKDTAGGTGPSSIHSENGFGSSARVPGVEGADPRAGEEGTAGPSAGDGSVSSAWLLLTIVALVATLLGLSISRPGRGRA